MGDYPSERARQRFESHGTLDMVIPFGRHSAIALMCLAMGACTAERVELLVDLRTDFGPGDEFVRVNSILRAEGDALGDGATRPVTKDDPVFDGIRIAEFANLEKGRYRLIVQLEDVRGGVVIERPVDLKLRESFAVTVLLTRDCLNVTCADPVLPACLQAVCVAATCAPETRATCPPPTCNTPEECPEPTAECAEARCEVGACLQAPRSPPMCADEEYCDPEVGCRTSSTIGTPDSGTMDAGGLDAASIDAALADANTPPLDGGTCPDCVCERPGYPPIVRACMINDAGMPSCGNLIRYAPCRNDRDCNVCGPAYICCARVGWCENPLLCR